MHLRYIHPPVVLVFRTNKDVGCNIQFRKNKELLMHHFDTKVLRLFDCKFLVFFSFKKICPPSGFKTPEIIFDNVLFPAPFSPTSAITSPLDKVMLISSRTVTELKDFRIFLISTVLRPYRYPTFLKKAGYVSLALPGLLL